MADCLDVFLPKDGMQRRPFSTSNNPPTFLLEAVQKRSHFTITIWLLLSSLYHSQSLYGRHPLPLWSNTSIRKKQVIQVLEKKITSFLDSPLIKRSLKYMHLYASVMKMWLLSDRPAPMADIRNMRHIPTVGKNLLYSQGYLFVAKTL